MSQEQNLDQIDVPNPDMIIEDADEKLLNSVDEIESLCMNCGEDGITRLMMHKIPYFRELIIASFRCEECGEYNNEVTFGGEIQLQGCVFELNLTCAADLDRQVIKSDSASLKIPSMDFEIPPLTQKGEISTLEGFLHTAAKNLSLYQEERLRQTPEIGVKVAEIISQLERMATGQASVFPFKIIVDDPSGNSFIQNPNAPAKDPNLRTGFYYRSPEQDISLGLQPSKGLYKDDKDTNFKALITGPAFGDVKPADAPVGEYRSKVEETDTTVTLGRSEVVSIPSPCPNCSLMGDSLTALTDIPHFKEVIIMAFDCPECGYKNSEIRGGGAVPLRGSQITLKVTSPEDLKRDCLKADSAMVMLPELDLELSHGTLGGLYTTVEGLLNKILVQLTATNPFSTGDSTQLHHSASGAPSETRAKFEEFLSALEGFTRGTRMPFTLVLRDPLGNSFVSAPLGSFLPPEADDNLTLEEFERSFEENDEFGLNDIKTSEFESEMPESYGLSDVAAGTGTSNASHAKRVVDHPTFFAKGMEDSTPGGAALTASSTVNSTGANIPSEASIRSDAAANEAWYSTATLPLGWVALKPGQEESSNKEEDTEEDGALKTIVPSFGSNAKATTITVVGRHFSPEDKNLTFMVREEFGGKREGMVFRMGLQGLGYYEDNLASLLLKKDAVIER